MPTFDLQSWQDRLGLSQVEAARCLGAPVQTYRNWLHGRREMPPSIALLCRYVERFGPLPQEAA